MEWRCNLKRHNILVAVAFTALTFAIGLGLAACQGNNKNSLEQGETPAGGTEETQGQGETISLGGGKRDSGKAAGYQFVSGYGICEPNQDVIWQLAPGEKPVVENELGKAELLQAVYQNQVLTVTVRLTDRSVTKVSDSDKNAFLEKERQNQLLQERGEPAEELPDYICIDSEQELYVNSPLMTQINGKKTGGGDRLYGAGISERGFTFNSSGSYTDYDSFLNEGYLTFVSEKRITAVHFDMKEPEGVYQLQLEGFDEPLSFSFAKAPEYQSLDEIEGIAAVEDGSYMLALGTKKEKGISVLCYVWPGEGYDRMRLTGVQLAVDTADGMQQTIKPGQIFQPESFPDSRGNELFRGFVNGNLEEYWFELPENAEVSSAKMIAEAAILRSDAVSDEVTIPVPQGELALDETVEIGGARLYLTNVRKLDGLFDVGTVDDEPIRKPAVYVAARFEPGDPDKSLEALYGIDSRYKIGSPELQYTDSFSNDYTRIEADMGEDKDGAELKGLHLYYKEGEQELELRFLNPFYRLNRSFEVPIRLTGGM